MCAVLEKTFMLTFCQALKKEQKEDSYSLIFFLSCMTKWPFRRPWKDPTLLVRTIFLSQQKSSGKS